MEQNHLASFDHMVQLPSLHLQLDNQWHSEATTLDMKSLEQGFHCPRNGSDLMIFNKEKQKGKDLSLTSKFSTLSASLP